MGVDAGVVGSAALGTAKCGVAAALAVVSVDLRVDLAATAGACAFLARALVVGLAATLGFAVEIVVDFVADFGGVTFFAGAALFVFGAGFAGGFAACFGAGLAAGLGRAGALADGLAAGLGGAFEAALRAGAAAALPTVLAAFAVAPSRLAVVLFTTVSLQRLTCVHRKGSRPRRSKFQAPRIVATSGVVQTRETRQTRHCSKPCRKISRGRSIPMNTSLLFFFSPGAQTGPRSLPISWCTPWKTTLRSVPFM